MLTKRQMIVLDVTEMPDEINKAIRSWYSDTSQNIAIFFDVPSTEDIYESDEEQQISEYLVSEGIEPGTEVLIHYWW